MCSSDLVHVTRWAAPSGAHSKAVWLMPDRRVEMDLGFEGMGVSQTALECAPEGAAQRVTWTMAFEAGNNPMKRYFGLFFDRVIGPDYEKGLVNMKALLETKIK